MRLSLQTPLPQRRLDTALTDRHPLGVLDGRYFHDRRPGAAVGVLLAARSCASGLSPGDLSWLSRSEQLERSQGNGPTDLKGPPTQQN